MIEISYQAAFTLYLCMTVAVVLGFWIARHFSTKNRKLVVEEKELKTCEYCHFAYLDERGKEVTRCPQCRSFNK